MYKVSLRRKNRPFNHTGDFIALFNDQEAATLVEQQMSFVTSDETFHMEVKCILIINKFVNLTATSMRTPFPASNN